MFLAPSPSVHFSSAAVERVCSGARLMRPVRARWSVEPQPRTRGAAASFTTRQAGRTDTRIEIRVSSSTILLQWIQRHGAVELAEQVRARITSGRIMSP